ncbi:DUF2933 domain-containing protein [Niallia endozanthoxylica]|uniref:DUF2933 domain-containing protein n=1 Tax=Niallia endozanthoxylica TaxID=2036016 RepID=A0A5J5HJN6_9BACI|nr:DUF2933 domain-containing protein [Niallia endozanthoxylica]KAA9021049.1 DUF2933 domain-containing protein [Niallia endozanthoxylica]
MEWLQYLLLLVCPLMMIFCMKGHRHVHKEQKLFIGMDSKLSNLELEINKRRNELDILPALVKKILKSKAVSFNKVTVFDFRKFDESLDTN